MGIRLHIAKRDERTSVLQAISSLKRAVGVSDMPGRNDEFKSTLEHKGLVGQFFGPAREVLFRSPDEGCVYSIFTQDSKSVELLAELLNNALISGLPNGMQPPYKTFFDEKEIEGGGYQLSVFVQTGREPRFLAEIERMTKKLIAPTKANQPSQR